MCLITSYNSDVLLQATVEQFDGPVCEAGSEQRRRPVLARNRSHRAVRVGLDVLLLSSASHSSNSPCDQLYLKLRLRMRVPHPDNPRITTDEQVATVLFPRGDDTRTAPHPQDLVQPTERADHLHGALSGGWVVVSIQTNNTVRYQRKGVSLCPVA